MLSKHLVYAGAAGMVVAGAMFRFADPVSAGVVFLLAVIAFIVAKVSEHVVASPVKVASDPFRDQLDKLVDIAESLRETNQNRAIAQAKVITDFIDDRYKTGGAP